MFFHEGRRSFLLLAVGTYTQVCGWPLHVHSSPKNITLERRTVHCFNSVYKAFRSTVGFSSKLHRKAPSSSDKTTVNRAFLAISQEKNTFRASGSSDLVHKHLEYANVFILARAAVWFSCSILFAVPNITQASGK